MTEQEIERCLERFTIGKATDVMNFDYSGTLAYLQRLKAENAALRKGIEGEEAFPVNFGDRVYIINFHKPKEQWKVGCGIVKTISITQTPDRTQLVFRVKIRYRNGKEYVLGRNAFLSIESAEARLAELKGGKK